MSSQIVDTESAKEFMMEILGKVSLEELAAISQDLSLKSETFRSLLGPENIENASEEDFLKIFRSIFSTRRKAGAVLKRQPVEALRQWTSDLLHGPDDLPLRFETFCNHLDGAADSIGPDLAGELLHFTFPNKYWLWSRWIWDPKNRTGSLPLVVTENYELSAPTAGEMYMKVGKATAFVHHVGEAAGFQTFSRSLFGTDVYLCCVYVIYSYTVLRMRMTQEFNKVVPGLEEFSRRLLGVYNLEEYHHPTV